MSSLNAQELTIAGSIYDSETKKGIPFASLVFETIKKGTSTDEEGNFRFVLDAKLKGEFVKLSCVGYEPVLMRAGTLDGAHVYLEQKTDELAEVQVYQMLQERRERVNSFRGKQIVGLGNFSGGAYPSALARYYERPDDFDAGCFLSAIEIQFYNGFGIRPMPAKFRLRILSVAADGKPGTDLLGTDFILHKDESARKVKLDLKPYKLNIPQEGFFVAVEHLFIEENKFTERLTVRLNDSSGLRSYNVDRYAPVFKGVETATNDQEVRCYYQSISGWKPIDLLNTAGSALKGKFPAPAFKLVFTD